MASARDEPASQQNERRQGQNNPGGKKGGMNNPGKDNPANPGKGRGKEAELRPEGKKGAQGQDPTSRKGDIGRQEKEKRREQASQR